VTQVHMTDLLDTNQRKLIENLCIDRLETEFLAMTGAELGKGLETGDHTAEKEVLTEETGDRAVEIRDQQAEIGGLITERHKIAQRH